MQLAIIGGSGTYGNEAVSQAYSNFSKIVIYSRDEYKQALMQTKWPEYPDNRMRYRIGDVRDYRRLRECLEGIDYVILAAAQKRIDTCERDPFECHETIVNGAINTVRACIDAKVKKCLFLSTDKSVNPLGIYGTAKCMAEKLIIAGNDFGETKFSAVRYQNVKGSRGSVYELWDKLYADGKPLPLTESLATRMWMDKMDAVKFTLSRLEDMKGYEIFIPEVKERSKLIDVIYDRYPGAKTYTTGFRCLEKYHEELLTVEEELRTYSHDGYYIVYPFDPQRKINIIGKKVPVGTHKKLRSDYGL